MGAFEDVIKGARQWLLNLPDPVYLIDLHERFLWGNKAYEVTYGNVNALPVTAAVQRIPIVNENDETIAYSVVVKEDSDAWELEARYRIIAENTSDTIVLVDHQAIVHYVSPSILSLTGYHVYEYEGFDAFDIIHPEDRERVRSVHQNAVQTKQSTQLEYRLIHKEGYLVHIEASVRIVLDGSGEVKYVVAVARDISERKESEELLENILNSVNAAVWSTDKDFRRYSFCSESIEAISGIPRKEIMNNPIRLHDHIHPDDNVVLMGEVKSKLDEGISIRQAIRYIHVEGEIRWGELIIHPWKNHAGVVERLNGLLLDITEKMRSELALEESEQRYKSLFENNLDGVFSIELNGFYFVNANRSFENIIGAQLSQLKGRCFLGTIYDEDHPQIYEAILEVMQQGKPRDLECRLLSCHGQRIASITFVPIYLSGSLNGIHGIVKDITRRKLEEQELVQSEERHKFLQQRLNGLSNDLANVMKVSELEHRLLEEVLAVLQVSDASIEEVPHGQEAAAMDAKDTWIPIGEKKHPVYLRIVAGNAFLPIEKQWLETAVHYVTLLYDNLRLIEDLIKRLEDLVTTSQTPKWMLRLLFKLSEKERFALSSDLHDSVLQDLIIWYRRLESLRSDGMFGTEAQGELKQIEEGLLDAIHQIRITCNELRPPFLLKMGLVESLKSLFEYTRMFANYEIEFNAGQPSEGLSEEQILGIYRIVQELLNNASKHSKAEKVTMSLSENGNRMHFTYSDDGVGMDLSAFDGSFQHMGLAGMEKRVLSLEGKIEFQSAPQQGVQVMISFPKN
ncbi:sensor histidine kinase [Paenibacillus planticolens]|uniref:histidine kinase n=1 Tax=Paenibacillus planticolens TaxID=2654976 RepID=A0ABX1ZWU8_9BACL|nr:PAS domain S-box protein [Paenibacillus planticolens]NOV04343.1 PAS domain S-box protein [Paenibacillus planticolens]